LLAASLLAVIAKPLCAQSVEEGVEAWQQGNYAEALATWQPLAQAGDADAQYNLGQAYRIGRGAKANAAESRKWFELAAKQGQVDAQAALGLMLMQADDQTDALHWLKLAAEQNEPRAMLVYGAALYKGEGVPRDAALGYDYVSKAATLGLEPAKRTLAQIDALNAAQETAAASIPAPAPIAAPVATPVEVAAAPPQEPAIVPPEPVTQAPVAVAKPPEPAAAPKPVEVAAAEPRPVEPPPEVAPPPKAVEMASIEVPKKVVAQPKAGSAPTGAWRVQLGAFSQKGNAEGLYKKLAGTDALTGRKPFYVAAGGVTKLQVGPFESKSAAQAACNALANACMPVTGK
jgi:hypothetical protein